ncbi:ABC transporter ATP-binding protein [Georgenia yuyongxinii]|uniref:ABC transporter ATP-binding protein n=1 Tax=Georgenia yuyongxinii TaxID=2589797 RepID=A0A552WSK3_9MICO|nr:ABC transporter ATP-binding protein [Georgenia yuyongxinii]TRW45831.1 ABC transporter ATP-binding protein [Georgenia yuyongxinii]
MSAPAVQIDDLKVQYGSDVVLDHMNLTIEQGQFVCLLGPSGCGKSTMLRIIGELTAHHGGVVRVGERPTHQAWDRLAYVFQAPRLVPWRNALDNVVLGMQLRGMPGNKNELREQARQALATVDIEHLANRPAHVLSGGEQQRVAIARGLAVQPEILLMDEPFSALDVQTRHQLREEIVRLWERTGLTIIFVTHDVDEAIIVGNRIVVFSPKPTITLADIAVDLPHPTDPLSPEYQTIRNHIVAKFGNDPAVDELTETNLR